MMKLITILILMTLLVEGCSLIGYGVGSRINNEIYLYEPFNKEEIRSLEKGSPIEVNTRDLGIVNGRFLSFGNDSLLIKIDPLKAITFLNLESSSLENNKLKIPINRIYSMSVVSGDSGLALGLVGLIIDVAVIYTGIKGFSTGISLGSGSP